jgi:hypothetical protein
MDLDLDLSTLSRNIDWQSQDLQRGPFLSVPDITTLTGSRGCRAAQGV